MHMATTCAWVMGVCGLTLTLIFEFLLWEYNDAVPSPYAESVHYAEAMANVSTDSDSDFEPILEPNTNSKSDSDLKLKIESKLSSDSDIKLDPNADSDSNSDSKVDPNSDSKVNPNSDSKVDPNSDSKVDPNSDTESNSKSDSKPDSKSDSDTVTDSKICGSNPQENDAPCSLQIFQTYYSACNKLPDAGTWSKVRDFIKANGAAKKANGALPRFRTPLCLPYVVTPDALVTRLVKTDIRRILMVGDSHGFRYFKSLRAYILGAGYSCKLIIREEGPRDGPLRMQYYLSQRWEMPMDAFIKKKRGCGSCVSSLYNCKHKQNQSLLEVEFLGMVLSADYILPNPTYCSETKAPFCKARNERELIFKYYLADRKPDVVMICTTSSHDFRRRGKENVKQVADIMPFYQRLKSLLDHLHPQVVMWIPTVFQRHQAYANEVIAAFNQALFEMLKPGLTPKKKKVAKSLIGFDHVAMAKDINGIPGPDAIHYHLFFYQQAMDFLMDQFCTMY